jgi:UDP-N-acetylmuramyl pentapeptide phosphotransferase/UDP-N-acetylglucosamine-1-phosphate transferase
MILRRLNITEKNFRGNTIPVSFGISLLLSSELLLIGVAYRTHVTAVRHSSLFASTIAMFALLGFLDDRFGEKSIKGLKGHFRSAAKGKITTGFVKATGGLAWSLYCGLRVSPHSAGKIVLNGLVIALCANLFNLLDLRPGRSSAVFLVSAGSLLAVVGSTPATVGATAALSAVVIAAIPCWILDSRAKVMLGDTGSNLLGGSLGLTIALLNSSVLSLSALGLLIFIHAVAERKSLTAIIAANPILSMLDKLTGVRS